VLADGAHAIVNLAGENVSGHVWTDEFKKKIRASRIDAGKAVVEAIKAAKKKPRVVIQASGIGYYGPHGDEELDEENAAGEDFLADVAVQWEASTEPVGKHGTRRAIIRTGVVLSREGGALERMVLPFKLFLGGPLGSGRQWFPWIHISDEVRAIRFLIEQSSASGSFNLAAPNPTTSTEFSRTLGSILKRPALLRVPEFILKIPFGEMASMLVTGQRALPKRLLEAGFVFSFPTLEGALQELLK
jgi:uncharacterized protein (TIGR01777 family)